MLPFIYNAVKLSWHVHSVITFSPSIKDIANRKTCTVQQEIFVSEKFRQKRPSGSSSGIYFRQMSVVAHLLFGRSVVALLLIVYLHIHEPF